MDLDYEDLYASHEGEDDDSWKQDLSDEEAMEKSWGPSAPYEWWEE